jgi:hypothetical protein
MNKTFMGIRQLSLRAMAVVLLLAVSGVSLAQDIQDIQDIQDNPPELPNTRNLAAALSDPSSRIDTLLTLISVSRLLQGHEVIEPDRLAELEAAFREDRAWLDRLAARYSRLPSRSTILDPASWFIQTELGQHAILPSSVVSPLGPDFYVLQEQLFDRSDERLAAAFLPEVLFQIEFMAVGFWQHLTNSAQENELLLTLVSNLHADWFDPWKAAEPPAPIGSTDPAEILDESLQSLQALMSSILLPEPPDELAVKRLRFSLFSAMPEMDERQDRTARHLLRMTSAIDGLHDRRYLEFMQSLLWVVTDLLEMYVRDPDAWSPLPQLLTEYLPRLSGSMARNFSEVDPRFNANLAAAFDVVQDLYSGDLTGSKLAGMQQELADAVVQLVLQVPDMAFYFDQPVRNPISREIDICISVAAVQDEQGTPSLSRQQFDGCIASMVRLADTLVRRAELSGDLRGPFGDDQLKRELEMTPWQRINYALGYLHERMSNTCPAPGQPLPNPLEWSALATLVTWLSGQSPVYLQTPENEALILAMKQQGLELLQVMSRQVDCISGSGGGINDLVSASLQEYQSALVNLVGGIRKAELEFRETRLRAGADVALGGEVTQDTSYRTAGLNIKPCDAARVCEMSQELEATRALIGQFPDEYLIADQTGLGDIEICYDNMQWIDRRAQRVREEDPNVANYYGRLSFDLLGRYHEGSEVTQVFGANFISPDEYHYLIAGNSAEVLDDGCPTEWVGSRIVTTRTNDGSINIVPNRLTYLSAARSKPSEVINSNWSRGAEWRDWFVTGIGITAIEFPEDPNIRDRLGQHLRALYQAEQRAMYSALLRPPLGGPSAAGEGDIATPLFELMNNVTMYKSLLRNQLVLFYPEFMLDSDEIRAALEGQSGLLEESVLRRFQENGIAIGQIHDLSLDRLQQFQSTWKRQPEAVIRSGSVATSVAHALARLNALYQGHFALPVSIPPVVEADLTVEPVDSAGG